MYVCMYVCMYKRVYVGMCVCVCLHIHACPALRGSQATTPMKSGLRSKVQRVAIIVLLVSLFLLFSPSTKTGGVVVFKSALGITHDSPSLFLCLVC